MDPLREFLRKNPSETILMSIKPEGEDNIPSFIQKLESVFVKNSAYPFHQGTKFT